ncbi:antibiotic biosynthesis monooxygenase [Streptomyces sp. NPDC050738]|uniref:antibiotic biosynthesis monooxygenase n=1 Tax=Streptomyces sp. NPDC050738 TaxID=3154744 RepID=UPI0034285AFE
MLQRDTGPRVTAVGCFNATGPAAVFERDLLAYALHREACKGFVLRVTVELVDRPGAYVHLDQWEGLDALVRTGQDEDRRPAVRPPADPLGGGCLTVSVGRVVVGSPVQEALRLLVVQARVSGETSRFEQDFGALAGQCVHDEGFGGSDLLRSVTDPQRYTGLLWWRDPAACDRTLAADGFLQRHGDLARSADALSAERGRPLRGAR